MLRLLDRLEEAIIAFLIGAATLIIFAAVVHRYGLGFVASAVGTANQWGLPGVAGGARSLYKFLAGINMTWAQELTIYMFVWMAKFGAAYGVRTGIHVGVDVLINQMQARTRVGFILFGLLAGALFTGIVGSLGANFVWHIYHTDQTSADLEVPMWLVYLCVPIGSWLMSFRFLQVAVSYWKTGQLPKHDHGHVAGLDEEEARA
ncbi:TRAP transporter small permease [Pinisolibacter sp.]|uniref:TRAP transporter small permease n=1 Tax=Pinisolibacter sp. TaxID=2172024 RepID=UPI002FDE125B